MPRAVPHAAPQPQARYRRGAVRDAINTPPIAHRAVFITTEAGVIIPPGLTGRIP